jgi:hypothetical protein
MITGLLLLTPAVVYAQDDAPCELMRHDTWKQLMDEADTHINKFDLERAQRSLKEAHVRIRCMEEPINPAYLTRFARLSAQLAFFGQDEIATAKWLFVSKYTFESLPWPEGIDEMHPMRETLDMADEPTLTGPAEKGLMPPKKGAVFMNGRLLKEAKGYTETPALIQLFDADGQFMKAWWQEDPKFRDEILGSVGEVKEPKWYVPFDDAAAIAEFETMYAEGTNLAVIEEVASAPKPETVAAVAPKPVEVVEEEPLYVIPELQVNLTLEILPERIVSWSQGASGELIAEATGEFIAGPAPVVVPVPTPEVPVIAETPEEPEVIETPEEPVVVETPEPEVPEEPVVETPEEPEVAETPEEPVIETPEEPVVAEVDPPDPEPVVIVKPDPKPNTGGPKINIARVAIGGGLGVAAGSLYVVAGVTKGAMPNSTSEKQLAGRRTTANLMVLSSILMSAGAVGVGVTAFVDADGGVVGLNGKF